MFHPITLFYNFSSEVDSVLEEPFCDYLQIRLRITGVLFEQLFLL